MSSSFSSLPEHFLPLPLLLLINGTITSLAAHARSEHDICIWSRLLWFQVRATQQNWAPETGFLLHSLILSPDHSGISSPIFFLYHGSFSAAMEELCSCSGAVTTGHSTPSLNHSSLLTQRTMAMPWPNSGVELAGETGWPSLSHTDRRTHTLKFAFLSRTF